MSIPFFKTVVSEKAITQVVEVLRSGWLTTGKHAKAFEEEFAEFVGGRVEAIAVNSATAGLHLALEALGIGKGDEVIVPTLTFTASAEVAAYLEADVVLVDIAPENLCASFEQIEALITDRTKAVVFVHFGGYPVDIRSLAILCRSRGIALVEDAAHALPSYCDGVHIGTNGSDAAVFSFYANKTMTTGEGGMIITNNAEIAKRCRVMRTHGIDRDAFARFTGKSNLWSYDVVEAGYKYNLTDIAAALGRVQLSEAMKFHDGRSKVARRYDEALADLAITLPPRPPAHSEHSWHLYPVQFDGGERVRNKVMACFDAKEIGYSVHYTPLHKLTYWSAVAKFPQNQLSQSERYFESCISLPIFPTMSNGQIERVVAAIREALADETNI